MSTAPGDELDGEYNARKLKGPVYMREVPKMVHVKRALGHPSMLAPDDKPKKARSDIDIKVEVPRGRIMQRGSRQDLQQVSS